MPLAAYIWGHFALGGKREILVSVSGVNSVALRKAINQGWVPGPRIYTSGKSLATTGGHADPTNGLRGDYRRDAGPVEEVINGPSKSKTPLSTSWGWSIFT